MDMKIDTQKLIELRNAKAWSQQHLADVSGLSLRTIQRIEKNQSASQESVKAIAAAFDGTPDMLLVTPHKNEQQTVTSPPNSSTLNQMSFSLSRQHLMWLLGALIVSLVVTMYWSQAVNAIDSKGKVVEAGALVQIDDATLQDGTDWLLLVDSQRYAQSWDESGPIFKTSVTQAKWVEAMQLVRKPLGEATSRELATAQAPTTLPGLPDGEYLILTFSTQFDASSSLATETLSMVNIDGQYRTIGYFIR
ncbi:MAG: DUF4019 domain-containing protein [Pseudomonadota bacterium]|nr:DUF4019 domain-containing protein [Pseudomonadota bacterium]